MATDILLGRPSALTASQKTCHCPNQSSLLRGQHTAPYILSILEQRQLLVIAALSLVALSARSQGSITDSVHVIGDVTVKGYRMGLPTKTSTPVQILSHDAMQRMGAADVGDALKHLAGVQVKDYGGIGGLKTVDVRGMGAQHTGVSYDGVEVGDCQTGQVDLSRFTVENVSCIKLVIGQDGDIYQSAKSYASAARVEIASAFAGLSEVQRPWLGVAAKTGAYGLVNPTLFYGQHAGGWTWSAFADYAHADGSYPFRLWNGTQLISRRRINSDITWGRGELNLRFLTGKKQTLTWKIYGFGSWRGLPGAVIIDNSYAADRLTDKNVFSQLLYENIVSPRLKVKASAKWNYSWNRYTNYDAAERREDRYRQNETYLSATLWAEPVEGFHVSVAQDYAHNYLSMTIAGCPYPSRESSWTAMAANYERLKNVSINASLLYTAINEHVKTGTPSDGFHRLSPAFSLLWHPAKAIRLRLGYKDIFRTPTLNDLYYTGIGRRTLRPEKTRQWNLGATATLAASGRWAAITVDGYYGHVTDKIVAVPRMFLWSMMNVTTVRLLGSDITVTGGFNLAQGFSVQGSATYGYLSATDRTNRADMQFGDQIAYTPRHSATASMTLRTPWADLTYNLLAVSARYTKGYNIRDNCMAGYADNSLMVSRTVRIKHSELRLQLDLSNLGGHNYEVVRYYPMPGRNVKFTVGYTLK